MSHPKPTTKLEAVNRMLASIGERPVNDLEDTRRLDVVRAVHTLDEKHMQFQTKGWWFNTEYDVEFTPDAAGEYILSEDIIRVDVSDVNHNRFNNSTEQWVKRQDKLYNLSTRLTTGNTKTIKFDVIRSLTFEDLPETARAYLALRAAVTFQTRSVGSVKIFQFTEQEALDAWDDVIEESLDYEDLTLAASPSILPAMRNRS
jgi:hypothetical protein